MSDAFPGVLPAAFPAAFPSDGPALLLVGHRGHRLAEFGELENTLAAFDRALDCGCHGLELDIHATADGHLVVYHDPVLAGLPIAASRLGALRRRQPSLPTLQQVLRRYRRRCWLDLEVKAHGCERLLVATLRALPPRCGCVVSSFQPEILRDLASISPGLPLCLNLKRPLPWTRWRDLPLAAVALHVSLARRWYLARLRRRGLRIVVWTVNQPRRMGELARAGCDAIISDDPRLLVETCAPAPPTLPSRARAFRATQ